MAPALVLLLVLPVSAQTVPAGWKPIKDSRGLCQISVPPEWVPLSGSGGSAVFHDPSTAIAVVTSQPGQAFKPLPPVILKSLSIPKDKLFENAAKRIFYQDKISNAADDANAFTASVPGKDGTCSCRVVFIPSVGEETARKIATSLAPSTDEGP